MSRQALGQVARTVVRRFGLGVLLGIAGAFAVTLLSWMLSSATASADEEEPSPPLINVIGADDAVGMVDSTVHDALHDTVDAVTTKVLPPDSKAATPPALTQTLTHVDDAVGSLAAEAKPKHEPAKTTKGKTSAVRHAAAPAFVPAPPPEKPVISQPVRRPPVPVKAIAPVHVPAPSTTEHHTVPKGDQPEGPAAPAPQWGMPSAPAPSGSAGSGFHSPDTPVCYGGAFSFWTGRAVHRPLRSTGPVVLRTVNAQPGVTPD